MTKPGWGWAGVIPLLVALVVSVGCTQASQPSRELVVFGASSFTAVLPEIAAEFEVDHPDVAVTMSFDGSSSLVDQVEAGAPADVLITADATTMGQAVEANVVDATTGFAVNTLTLIVPPGNPAHVTGVNDSLDDADLVLCAPRVPCGATALELARLNGYSLDPVSEESQVSDVLGKVASGQADAGIVYVTDAERERDTVDAIDIDHADEVPTEAQVAAVSASEQGQLAVEFSDFLSGDRAQELLGAAGFQAP